jgi:hypothetical protein
LDRLRLRLGRVPLEEQSQVRLAGCELCPLRLTQLACRLPLLEIGDSYLDSLGLSSRAAARGATALCQALAVGIAVGCVGAGQQAGVV